MFYRTGCVHNKQKSTITYTHALTKREREIKTGRREKKKGEGGKETKARGVKKI